jgi:hypothetical protein
VVIGVGGGGNKCCGREWGREGGEAREEVEQEREGREGGERGRGVREREGGREEERKD